MSHTIKQNPLPLPPSSNRLTSDTWTVKQTPSPMLAISMTAGMADRLIPSRIITPNSWISMVTILNTIRIEAQTDRSSRATKQKAATRAHPIAFNRHGLRFIYCSQKRNGIPVNEDQKQDF